MKRLLLNWALGLGIAASVSGEEGKELSVAVVFENGSGKAFKGGVFYIPETGEKFDVDKAEPFSIRLPEKGKYSFSFSAAGYIASMDYPSRITKKKNTVTIRLVEKNAWIPVGSKYPYPLGQITDLTDEQIEQCITDGNLNFIIHGIDGSIPVGFEEFKEKYRIGLVKENCVIDPLSFKRATENNQMISAYLTRRYGDHWLDELPGKPLGLN